MHQTLDEIITYSEQQGHDSTPHTAVRGQGWMVMMSTYLEHNRHNVVSNVPLAGKLLPAGRMWLHTHVE